MPRGQGQGLQGRGEKRKEKADDEWEPEPPSPGESCPSRGCPGHALTELSAPRLEMGSDVLEDWAGIFLFLRKRKWSLPGTKEDPFSQGWTQTHWIPLEPSKVPISGQGS